MHLGINVYMLPHLCPFVFRTAMKLPHCQLFSFNVTIRLKFFLFLSIMFLFQAAF